MAAQAELGTVCVVGGGCLGAATAKHLLEAGAETVVVLDGAKSAKTRRRGAHHDGARLIRAADAEGDAKWSARNAQSLAAFPSIQSMSEINFFHKSGALVMGPADFVSRAADAAEGAGCELERLDEDAAQVRFPFLAPSTGCGAACVDANAGWIDPDAMIEAQFEMARRTHPGKLDVVPCVARSVTQMGDAAVFIETDTGNTIVADRCVVAAGVEVIGKIQGYSGYTIGFIFLSVRTQGGEGINRAV